MQGHSPIHPEFVAFCDRLANAACPICGKDFGKGRAKCQDCKYQLSGSEQLALSVEQIGAMKHRHFEIRANLPMEPQ